ncbi:MAG: hypothetical protein H7641_04300 [Candidatus Heimdallarchaeota archaeon]|nr:hypothetical protein [Candidatus Heimdallarchaeota archaeon]MCK4876783.1 hypothetical protein [Candidatus Heimdallarchaeota archaeon]
MIHLIAFMNIESGLGRRIYSDETLMMSEELVWPMICALNNFVIECTKSERGLINAALEDIKIYLYSPLGESNPLRFIFFTDLFDNNEYLELRGQAIFEILSQYISFEIFDPPVEIMNKVLKIAQYTQEFPSADLESFFVERLKLKLNNLEDEGKILVADLFVGDIDQGKVFSLAANKDLQEKNSVILFSELLTAFSIDSEIFVKSSLTKREKEKLERMNIRSLGMNEGWFLKQLVEKNSDFWLVGYFFFKENSEEEIEETLNWITVKLSEEIMDTISERPF